MVELPTREVRTADIPILTLAVRCQDKRAFACPHQHSYVAHLFVLARSNLVAARFGLAAMQNILNDEALLWQMKNEVQDGAQSAHVAQRWQLRWNRARIWR